MENIHLYTHLTIRVQHVPNRLTCLSNIESHHQVFYFNAFEISHILSVIKLHMGPMELFCKNKDKD